MSVLPSPLRPGSAQANILHLPNGQTITVSPVFGGLFFKANDLNLHHAAFSPGWTIIIESEGNENDRPSDPNHVDHNSDFEGDLHQLAKRHQYHRYRTPTLRNDTLFMSTISNPSDSDFRPAISPTRQTAMMLWATLWWYFHQPTPDPHLSTPDSSKTPLAGRPKGEWRVNIKREGIFKGRHLLQKLERMSLISSEDSSVGSEMDDRHGDGWTEMFVSQRSFWQLDPRLFLFTLSPTMHSPFQPSSPYNSRPGSPVKDGTTPRPGTPSSPTTGPFQSGSHLPTYYPPPPAQYTFTNSTRHPLRPKPPRQGETFYTRYVPSLGQYLSFRVASLSQRPTTHYGPVSQPTPNYLPSNTSFATASIPSVGAHGGVFSSAPTLLPPPSPGHPPGRPLSVTNMNIHPCDTDLLHKWMNDPRVSAAWGVSGPLATQEAFLESGLKDKHSFPAIGCFDGKPFGYFEIYWVKEDRFGAHIAGNDVGDWDRGIHVLVGEQEFRGPHRVSVWLSALVHYCWLADQRTMNILMEPRADHDKIIQYLLKAGFYKQREIAFPHKQAALMKIRREAWDAPAL